MQTFQPVSHPLPSSPLPGGGGAKAGIERAQSDPIRRALTLAPMSLDLSQAWSQLGAYFSEIIDRFGPAQSWMEERFTKRARRTIEAWLDACEAALRQMLMLEARGLTLAPSTRAAPQRRVSNAAPLPVRDIPERALGVEIAPAFKLFPPSAVTLSRDDDMRPPRSADMRETIRRSPTRKLARRMAALEAALADADLYVRRMARALAKNNALVLRIAVAKPDPTRLPRALVDRLQAETTRLLRASPTDSS